MSKQIVFVLSSTSQMGSSGIPTGNWLEELAAPYWRFHDKGYAIRLASPKGQKAPLDPESLKENWLSEAGRRFLTDPATQSALASTIPLSQIDASTIDGIFLVGGAATTWDFPLNDDIKRIAEQLYAKSKVIAGICHGVIGLTRVVDQYGESLLKNRAMTSISNLEDMLMGIDKVVPILPEDMLRKSRALYSAASPLAEYVVCDAPFFTGQNPTSADLLARKVIDHLGASV